MKKIDVDEMKRIQVEILNIFDSFCKENGIKYWLDYGTLLGAIRHKGYIPWDDDIDIGMLRSDYCKAEEFFNKYTDGKYVFKTPKNDKEYRYPFGKIIATDTVLYEYGRAGVKIGVYVDVFPYDNSPNTHLAEKVFKLRDLLGRVRRLQLPMREEVRGIKKILYFCGSTALKLIPKNTINRLIDKNARRFEDQETENIGSFTDVYDEHHLIIPKTLFDDIIEAEFEKKKYPIPKNYDYWLKCLYGDYMKLPPIEERVGRHTIDAYYIS